MISGFEMRRLYTDILCSGEEVAASWNNVVASSGRVPVMSLRRDMKRDQCLAISVLKRWRKEEEEFCLPDADTYRLPSPISQSQPPPLS